MESLLAGQLSGWDFLIAGIIVAIVEWPIKTWICKDSEKLVWVYKWSPVVLGAITYIVMALIQKSPMINGAIHGLGVGFAAMGSYDLILKTIKDTGIKSAEEVNEAVKKAIEDKK